MILPEKHIKLSESLLGLGGYVLKLLDKPRTIDDIWREYSKVNNTNMFPAYHGFDNLILAVDFLFTVGAVDIMRSGEIYNALTETNSK